MIAEEFELYFKFKIDEENSIYEGIYYQPSENTELYIAKYAEIDEAIYKEFRASGHKDFPGSELSVENLGEHYRDIKLFWEFLYDKKENDVMNLLDKPIDLTTE